MYEENIQTRLSLALFLPLIWFFVATTRNLSIWMPRYAVAISDTDIYLEGSPFDRYFYSVLIAIGAVILLWRWAETKRVLHNNIILILLIAYLLISISWSEYQYVALKRWFKVLGALIMVLIIKTEKESKASSYAIMRRVFFIHIPLSIILIRYFRSYGIMWQKDGSGYMWTGLSTHKNVLGQMLMFSNLYFLYELYFKRKFLSDNNHDAERQGVVSRKGAYFLILLLGIYLMFSGPGNSKSVTSIIALCFGLMIMYILSRYVEFERYPKATLLKIATAGFLLLMLANVFTMNALDQSVYDTGLQIQGKDETLTGRTDLWRDIIEIAKKNVILGVGYGSFWIGGLSNNLWERHIWKPQQAHNGYVDVLVETGIVGLLLLIVYIITSFAKLIEIGKVDRGYAVFAITVLSMIVVHNFAESSYLRGTHGVWFVFLLFTVVE